ncbi:hypothetical protein CTAYLR_002083 [Chrysophaeum taylorii]|uniref:Uncharacterized protein n=1 Tax=Chrysophaeum taylorii TaxID=2483200 RepID=A0AAD7XRA8_9STRA|nr:hypothetical protein CTAYLR_002083 [Chrysophaeum taylorii]
MLARCTKTVLTAPGGDEALEEACLRACRGGKASGKGEASVRGAIEYLESILLRSADDPSERQGGASAAIWAQALTAATRAQKKNDEDLKRRAGLFARWLLARDFSSGPELVGTAVVVSGRAQEEKTWARLAAAEMTRRACHVEPVWTGDAFGAVAPGAAAAFGARGLCSAFVEACVGTTAPTRAALGASQALHEVTHALARGAAWAAAAAAAEKSSDESDSDDDDDAREARARAKIGVRCREALWGLRAGLAAVCRVETRWYGPASTHRAAYVAAVADLRSEMGGDALSLESGEYDAAGAAAAAARRDSTVARGCEGVAEIFAAADEADRDGDEARARDMRAAARGALDASAARLAWLVRVVPPDELARDWGASKDAAAVSALEDLARELAGVAVDDDGDVDSDDDDLVGREYFRKIVERKAAVADVRRAVARRLCLLLGQLKRKRLEDIFDRRPDLQQSLHNSTSYLLKLKTGGGEDAKTSGDDFVALVNAATTSLAAIATKRVLDTAFSSSAAAGSPGSEQIATLAAPLLAILDDDRRDSVSATVGELVAPLALVDGSPVLRDILGRATRDKSLPALDALASILDRAFVDDVDDRASRRAARKIVAEDLVACLANGAPTSVVAEKMAGLFSRLDADVAIPMICARLATDEKTNRQALENAMGACLADGKNPASAVDHLAHALRNLHATDGNNNTAASSSKDEDDDGISLAPWVRRVLDRVPAWMAKLAASGGDRWTRAAETAARRAASSAKDSVALRIWGAVVDSLADDADPTPCRRALRRIILAVERQPDLASDADREALLFERLAPLLALKRVPVGTWTAVHRWHGPADRPTTSDDEDEDDDEDDSHSDSDSDSRGLTTERAAAACRKRAYASSEHNTVSTIAAEVLGRLPPSLGAVEAAPALDAFLARRDEPSADRARVATYALCHASSVHGLAAVRGTGALGAVLRALATEEDDASLVRVQQGCAHALAMLVGAEIGAQPEDKTRTRLLLVSEIEETQQSPTITRLLIRLASTFGVVSGEDLERSIREALALVLLADDVSEIASTLARALEDADAGALRVGCVNALVVPAQQLASPGLGFFADDVGSSALRCAGAVVCGAEASLIKNRAVAKSCAAAWLQLVFVLLVRTSRLPRGVTATDLFGVALQAARHSPASSTPPDVGLRRNGLKLLAAVLGVLRESLADLPPASSVQAISQLRGIAAMDPDRDLRQLATTLVEALAAAEGTK